MPVGALEKTRGESCIRRSVRGNRFHQVLSIQTLTGNAPLTPLDSALTSKRASKSFTSNTYEKHTGGRGVATIQPRTSNLRSLPCAVLADSFRLHASNRRIQQFHHVQDGQRAPVPLQP